jgi:hypothetical protein
MLLCPSMLQLTYYRRGKRHDVLLAWDIKGHAVVALRIERQFSGWHGHWHHTSSGGFACRMHYSGNNNKAWMHIFDAVKSRVYQIFQGHLIRAQAKIVTWMEIQSQLDNGDSVCEVDEFLIL